MAQSKILPGAKIPSETEFKRMRDLDAKIMELYGPKPTQLQHWLARRGAPDKVVKYIHGEKLTTLNQFACAYIDSDEWEVALGKMAKEWGTPVGDIITIKDLHADAVRLTKGENPIIPTEVWERFDVMTMPLSKLDDWIKKFGMTEQLDYLRDRHEMEYGFRAPEIPLLDSSLWALQEICRNTPELVQEAMNIREAASAAEDEPSLIVDAGRYQGTPTADDDVATQIAKRRFPGSWTLKDRAQFMQALNSQIHVSPIMKDFAQCILEARNREIGKKPRISDMTNEDISMLKSDDEEETTGTGDGDDYQIDTKPASSGDIDWVTPQKAMHNGEDLKFSNNRKRRYLQAAHTDVDSRYHVKAHQCKTDKDDNLFCFQFQTVKGCHRESIADSGDKKYGCWYEHRCAFKLAEKDEDGEWHFTPCNAMDHGAEHHVIPTAWEDRFRSNIAEGKYEAIDPSEASTYEVPWLLDLDQAGLTDVPKSILFGADYNPNKDRKTSRKDSKKWRYD